jgi:hypothetical protein
MAPLQNQKHGANAFDLGNKAVVCVDTSSSTVVAAGHRCRKDGLKPSGWRTFWSGVEVDDNYRKPSWHKLKRHDTECGDGGASAST